MCGCILFRFLELKHPDHYKHTLQYISCVFYNYVSFIILLIIKIIIDVVSVHMTQEGFVKEVNSLVPPKCIPYSE